jgi:hypothetical protein
MRRLQLHSPGLCTTLAVRLCLGIVLFHCISVNPVEASVPPSEALSTRAYSQEPGTWSFEFRNVTLDRALFLISERTGAEFIYEPRLTAGVMVTAEFKQIELGSILEALLLPSGLEARRIRTGIYVIRQSLRRNLPPQTLATRRGHESDPVPGPLQRVPSRATDHSIPIHEVIRQLALP